MSTYIKGNYRKSIFKSETGYHIGIFKVKPAASENPFKLSSILLLS